jgi:hypothetical protein
MASRKLAAVAFEDPPPRDDVADYIRGDDLPHEAPVSLDRVCLWCGGDGRAHEGCEHREIARFASPSRAIEEAALRLQQAASEHRAAARAMRALALSEVARDRAELETHPSDPPPAIAPAPIAAEPEAAPAPAPKPRKRARRAGGEQQAFLFAPEPPTDT